MDKVLVELGPVPTNSVSDTGWEIADPAFIHAWTEIVEQTSVKIFDRDGGRRYSLRVDWTPVLQRVAHSYDVMRLIHGASSSEEREKALNGFSTSKIAIEFQLEKPPGRPGPASIIEYYLNDIFLIMNISTPGSCDFMSAQLVSAPHASPMRLSNYFFDVSWINAFEGKWPPIRFLSIADTRCWFERVRNEFSLVPKNSIERALFAILHICKSDLSPATIVWIFNALESFYGTRPGENFRALIERISLLLAPNTTELAYMKKAMRNLYDLRSAFVHGGLDIIHPVHDEAMDEEVDRAYYRLMEASDFGFQILLASLQEVISRGWSAPAFHEVMEDAAYGIK